jgi:hypothetical protein
MIYCILGNPLGLDSAYQVASLGSREQPIHRKKTIEAKQAHLLKIHLSSINRELKLTRRVI